MGMISHPAGRRHATRRFEKDKPNQLWQMDFKGPGEEKASVGPLSVLDDHSRYLVGLEQIGQVQSGSSGRSATTTVVSTGRGPAPK